MYPCFEQAERLYHAEDGLLEGTGEGPSTAANHLFFDTARTDRVGVFIADHVGLFIGPIKPSLRCLSAISWISEPGASVFVGT